MGDSLAHNVAEPAFSNNLIFQKYQLLLFFTFYQVVPLQAHYFLVPVVLQQFLISDFRIYFIRICSSFGWDVPFSNGKLIYFFDIFVDEITSSQHVVVPAKLFES
jgi:hypothetical protein